MHPNDRKAEQTKAFCRQTPRLLLRSQTCLLPSKEREIMTTVVWPLPDAKGPKFVRYFYPIIRALSNHQAPLTFMEICNEVIQHYDIPENEIYNRTKGGKRKVENYINWARFVLVKADLIMSVEKGDAWTLNGKRKDISCDISYFIKDAFDIYHNVRNSIVIESGLDISEEWENSMPPDERKYLNEDQIRQNLVVILREMNNEEFENFLILLLQHAGFESVRISRTKENGTVYGKGCVVKNRFIRTNVVFKCKRYDDAKYSGETLQLRGGFKPYEARAGQFSIGEEEKEARRDGATFEFIDIDYLLDLMIEAQLGTEEVKALKIDMDFFKPYMPKE